MPRFDGTGPTGQGPMTGHGGGYCAIKYPASGQAPYGYTGVQGKPVRWGTPVARPTLGARFARGAGRVRGAGRGRGRGFGRR